ncbi:hypothetical protein [Mycolicibacterium vaccae]|uniref:hypothetical protein n=1 Tax=Mycolicibacterium vaccae TaxID=1810 RepID=UPI003CFCA772
MTAALDRIGTALTARPATVLFDALAAAERHVATFERIEWLSMFAPPPLMGGGCSCGSSFEVRRDRIAPTDEERLASAEAVADLLGRSLLDVDLEIVTAVVNAIEAARDRDDHEAFRAWLEDHETCRGDL